MTIKHSVSWWCFANKMTAQEFITAIKDTGYDGIDLVPREHWEAGLEVASVDGHRSIEDGLNRSENHDRIEGELLELIELAPRYGHACLVCFSGNRHDDTDERGIEVTAAGLQRVAPAAERAGVTLVLELLNSKVDHPDYQCDQTEWGVEVVRRVASPRVKLLYDIYHMQIMEGDLVRTIREHYEHIAHYHTGGNPGRNEIDERQEIYYPAVVAAIHELGYEGYLGQEFIPEGNPLESLKSARHICDERSVPADLSRSKKT